jgi:proline iminopeptidase
MKATIRGTEIYFDIAGMQLAPSKNDFVEKPVMFMLHGGPGGDHLRYKQHSIELQEDAQLVFIDHRGCGQSKKTKARDYTLENNIEDIEALRQHLGLSKICLLGTSYGGVVAQGYAIRYPKQVEKLILVVTAPSYRFLEEAKKTINKIGTRKQIAMCEHLWNGSFKNHQHVAEFFTCMETIYTKTAKKNPKKQFSKAKTIWSHDALNQGFGGFLRDFDYIPKLKKITCPTLVLGGEKDWICSAAQSKIIAKNIRNSQLKIFKEAGHAVAVDAHDQYIKIIKKFLANKSKK